MNATEYNVIHPTKLFFNWIDINLFVFTLIASALIGIYFGFWEKKENSPNEYFHGGRRMGTISVAVSLVVSFISGVLIMGAATEVYMYGTLYWLICVPLLLVAVVANYIYLPVFYELKITSVFEYLELRFNPGVRAMASALWTFYQIIYTPIVIYVPALAFSRVCDINVHFITPAVSFLCILYTMLGGIKAVVWTDVLQAVVLLTSGVAIIILGVMKIGGLETVLERNRDGGRIRIFEMSFSPFERLSFWIVIIGNIFHMTASITLNQVMVQRYLSLPTYTKARTSLFLSSIGMTLVISLSCYTGLLIYANFYDCDPLKSKLIQRPDQLLPHYVMDISSTTPGLPGLFIAGIFSAALSTMSSSLNSLGATIFEDFLRPRLSNNISNRRANKIIKSIIVIVGVICIFLTFVVDKLGNVLQLTMSFAGVTNGAMIGLFSFGMIYPRGNSKGALAGSIISMLFMSWIVFGTQKAIADGRIKQPVLPTSVRGCDFNVTLSEPPKTHGPDDNGFILYRVSFIYYTLMGMIVMLLVGTIVSLLTEEPELEKMNPILFAPIVRKYVEKKRRRNCRNKEPEVHELMEMDSPEQ